MRDRNINVLDGSTFVVGDRHGDVALETSSEQGFYSEDTRFISRWVLRIGASEMQLLGFDQPVHYVASFFLAPLGGPADETSWSVFRRRLVDYVWVEEITIINHLHHANHLSVALDVGADFADLFEVKDAAIAAREVTFESHADGLVLGYVRDGFRRAVRIDSSRPVRSSRTGLAYDLVLAAGEAWTVTLTLTPSGQQAGASFSVRRPRGSYAELCRSKADELEDWLGRAPALETEDPDLYRIYRASLTDLAALRLPPELTEGATLPAAGLPWFMALFGRDSLITSFQALPYLPGLAATTLRVLADRQASVRDDFHESEPGKILHELRFGELTARGERPHSPYFGSADATPLFLILLDEYHRWSGDDELVRQLRPNAEAALAWIEHSGDADGDGYVEYACRNRASGLVNQSWKDSWDAIQFADGGLAEGPIATSEIQGYVYDARRRCARLAREVWGDATLAERLDLQAETLRDHFRRDFWVAQRSCYALALDGDKQRVDSLTSNIGHLLWSGILDHDEANVVAERLLGDELYSGWGVRTLGAGEAGYNPLGYHTGTVWPHENSLIVAGLARYGHRAAAEQIAASILSAARYFEYRLPETFAGYPAAVTSVPVSFPTASRPQAWAAATPMLLLTTLLDLEPGVRETTVDVPAGIGRVTLHR